jgi:hypothetical protein
MRRHATTASVKPYEKWDIADGNHQSDGVFCHFFTWVISSADNLFISGRYGCRAFEASEEPNAGSQPTQIEAERPVVPGKTFCQGRNKKPCNDIS